MNKILDLSVVVLLVMFQSAVFASPPDSSSQPSYAVVKAKLIRQRDGLGNVLAKLRKGDEVKIAYLGGSITAANGWRVKTREWFQTEFPKAKVNEIHAAIGGTGSDLGVYRMQRDVLDHHPDLLFVEFAVNDGGASPERIWKAMEGIVRKTWAANPRTDICYVYTFRTNYEIDLRKGNCPRAASAMEMLADHYRIPSINFAMKIVELEGQGKLIFKSDEATQKGVIRFSKDGVHPLNDGHQIYSDIVADAIRQMKQSSKPMSHSLKLKTSFVRDHWQSAKMVPLQKSMLVGEWEKLPKDSTLSKRFGKKMGLLWESTKPGSKIVFKFKGSAVKIYDLVGPDGGQVKITVDGKAKPKLYPRFDSYCTYHRIATLGIATNLDPSIVHTVSVEIHPEQPNRQSVAFRLKNPEVELKKPKYQGTKVRASQIMVLGDTITE